MSAAAENAAERAEDKGDYRKAYGFWGDLIAECERYGIPNVELYRYYLRRRDYCRERM